MPSAVPPQATTIIVHTRRPTDDSRNSSPRSRLGAATDRPAAAPPEVGGAAARERIRAAATARQVRGEERGDDRCPRDGGHRGSTALRRPRILSVTSGDSSCKMNLSCAR